MEPFRYTQREDKAAAQHTHYNPALENWPPTRLGTTRGEASASSRSTPQSNQLDRTFQGGTHWATTQRSHCLSASPGFQPGALFLPSSQRVSQRAYCHGILYSV